MSMDLSEFYEVFYEECYEGLEIMENGLVDLDIGAADVEEINTIFRAAHSIKGGSATFEFTEIAAFTHVMETLLDQMRSGEREVSVPAVDLLLESVDCLKEMVDSTKDEEAIDNERVDNLKARLEEMLADAEPVEVDDKAKEKTNESSEGALNQPGLTSNAKSEVGEGNEENNKKHELPINKETGSQVKEANIPKKKTSSPAKKSPSAKKTNNSESGSIRVSVEKIDALINLVGELVITQSMLGRFGENIDTSDLESLRDGLSQLERNSRELQETAMQIRMLPISSSFNRFPRLIRDMSGKLDKKVELKITGENTELDKTVLEKIGDPLVHLVRNSLDHGLETPEVRRASGKPETGIIELNAYHEGGNIVIEVVDDGAGLNKDRLLSKAIENGVIKKEDNLTDEEIYNLIFKPGFSTAEIVSDVSGRGVGMDVVRRNISDLGGNVYIDSTPGHGSTLTIRLPLTLAIIDGQLVRVGDEIYVIPIMSISESLQLDPSLINRYKGKADLYKLRDEYIPILRLHDVFDNCNKDPGFEDGLMVVVEIERRRVGLFVDELLGQQQVVIKSLENNFRKAQGFSGATILGDGTVSLILDTVGLIRNHLDKPVKLMGADRAAA